VVDADDLDPRLLRFDHPERVALITTATVRTGTVCRAKELKRVVFLGVPERVHRNDSTSRTRQVFPLCSQGRLCGYTWVNESTVLPGLFASGR
jgi:hypothetical protein